jgi:hypothetical protein
MPRASLQSRQGMRMKWSVSPQFYISTVPCRLGAFISPFKAKPWPRHRTIPEDSLPIAEQNNMAAFDAARTLGVLRCVS